jgi:flagellar hook protein FlgE
MLSSMFTGVSGMNANGTALSVVSDNIANMNTTGFKASKASFGDVLGQSIGTSQIGGGTYLSSVATSYAQGSFENSTNVLDMAIDGNGFFVVQATEGTRYFTRSGEFHVDRDGFIVDSGGNQLQAFDSTTSALGNVLIGALNSPPQRTETIDIAANLDSREITGVDFAITDPTGTSSFSTTIPVYDSLGNKHDVTVYFQKTDANEWTWNAVANADEVTVVGTATDGTNSLIASGQLDFTSNGELDEEGATTYYNLAAPTGITFIGATAEQEVDFDFGTSITTDAAVGGTGLDGTTQFGSISAIYLQTQNGYGSGSLQSISVSADGTLTGLFTNGQSRGIAKIAIATFQAETELTKAGGNLYTESYESGAGIFAAPGSGGAGEILSNTLELSNVDLGAEFVRMIMNQRGFQANSRIVSVSNEILAELVNLSR